MKQSVFLIRIDVIDEFFKPVRAKNNHQQADRTGNRNGADAEYHEDNQDNCTFDSEPVGSGIHGDDSILVALKIFIA
jgi:hypothetical protein